MAVRDEAALDLQVTTRVGGGDDLGTGGCEVADLAVLQPRRGVGLGDVVDAGAAAAPLGLGAFAEFDAGEGFEDGAGLGADFLAVAEVAAFVVGDCAGGGGGGGFTEADFDEVLVDVAEFF